MVDREPKPDAAVTKQPVATCDRGDAAPARWNETIPDEEHPRSSFDTVEAYNGMQVGLDLITPDRVVSDDVGIGIVQEAAAETDGRPVTLLDWDDIQRPETSEIHPVCAWALEEVDGFAELSQLGEGIHQFVYGEVSGGLRQFLRHVDDEPFVADDLPMIENVSAPLSVSGFSTTACCNNCRPRLRVITSRRLSQFMSAIEVSSLSKRFGGITAVEDLSFSIAEGEVFGFLGPNGAGKSTTINILLGYMTPTFGSAKVFGHDVESASQAIRRQTGVLPENVGLYEQLTAREHVVSAVRFKNASDDPAELLARVCLSKDAWDRRAGGFSTGMAQRLGLATALAGDPDLLILDEPQSGLDPNGRREIRNLVIEESEKGTTVFFSSHILSEVQAVSDRVGVMRDGQMAALDTVESIRTRASDGTTLRLQTVESGVDERTLADIDGVGTVGVAGRTVTATCETPRAKSRVVSTVEDAVGVADFEVNEATLEDAFTALTDGADGTGGHGGTGSGVTATDENPETTDTDSEVSAS
jgi:ABC-2 type transport system ATP-binding protein